MQTPTLAPSEELAALRHFCTELERDYDELLRGYLRLYETFEAIMQTRDIVNKIGTQAAINRVFECCVLAVESPETRDVMARFIDEVENAIYCTDCGHKLSEASEAAGICLKCVAR